MLYVFYSLASLVPLTQLKGKDRRSFNILTKAGGMVKYLMSMNSSSLTGGRKCIWVRSKPSFKHESEGSSDGNHYCEEPVKINSCGQLFCVRVHSSNGAHLHERPFQCWGADTFHCKDTHSVVWSCFSMLVLSSKERCASMDLWDPIRPSGPSSKMVISIPKTYIQEKFPRNGDLQRESFRVSSITKKTGE